MSDSLIYKNAEKQHIWKQTKYTLYKEKEMWFWTPLQRFPEASLTP